MCRTSHPPHFAFSSAFFFSSRRRHTRLSGDWSSDRVLFRSLLPVFLTAVLGAGPAALGIIEGVAEATAALLKLYSGYLSDRVKKRKGWIVAGYSLSNIIRPLIALSTSWLQVLTLRF